MSAVVPLGFARSWVACLLSIASFLPGSAGWAADTSEAQNLADIVWLAQIQQAATRLNYVGTFVYQQGSQVQSSRISHFVDASGEHEKLEILDGKPQEIIRKNDEVYSYIPASKTLLIEKRFERDHFPGLLNASASEVANHYSISRGQSDRIAGIECETISLNPKDNLRYGYRLWADKQSGLLLKAQTLNEKNEVIEQIAFSTIKINLPFDRAQLKPSYVATAEWKIERSQPGRYGKPLTQWQIMNPPAGFKRVNELRRTLGKHENVSQIVFSDGLAAISVFIEMANAASTLREGSSSQGAVSMTTRRLGDHWITVIGEAPPIAIKQVAYSLQLKK